MNKTTLLLFRLLFALTFASEAYGDDVAIERRVQRNEEAPLPKLPLDKRGSGRPDYISVPSVQPVAAPTPEPVAVEQRKEDQTPDEVMVIRFAKLSAETVDVRTIVERIDALQKGPGVVRVHVVGNTDSDRILGKARQLFADNYELSGARAKLVATSLAKAGIQVPLTYEGRGADRPVAENDTPANKAKNRRTEVYLFVKKRVLASAPKPTPPPTLLSRLRCQGSVAPGTKRETASEVEPFRVTLDGEPAAESQTSGHVDFQRCTDVALENADVQVHFDALHQKKRLNVTAAPDIVAPGETMIFRLFSNYLDFIERAELRVFLKTQSTRTEPVDIVPFSRDGMAFEDVNWKPRNLTPQAYVTVLRVYDADGNFDETQPKDVEVRAEGSAGAAPGALLAGYGEDRMALSNIPVSGGTITVNGENVPDSHTVRFLGMPLPLASDGKFVGQQLLRSGKNYGVEVSVTNHGGEGMEFRRDLHIPRNDWFLIGIADVLVGGHRTKGPAALVNNGGLEHFDKTVFVDGRLAFYLKGKIQGKYLLTASADTREGPLRNIFSNFLDKDPQALFRRLDPDKFYPVYGDDSTFLEDAPTQGKFYVKLERDSSYVMWGNFRTTMTETELAQIDRGLYGANLHLETTGAESRGQRKTRLDAFAATPGTASAREEFRGTGGSEYWFRHRDISNGSERLRVEIRDRNSGIVLKMTPLRAAEDYVMNALQGRVILKTPLPAFADDSELVHAGSLTGHSVFLVARYEYTPGFDDPGSLALGGRATHWIGDALQVGATAARQNQPGGDQTLFGGDATLRLGGRSYVKAEAAQTDGPGPDEQYSLNGGYNFTAVPQLRQDRVIAKAFRTEASFGLYDMDGRAGGISAYQRKREAGFSAPGELSLHETDQWGGKLDIPVSGNAGIIAKHDRRRERTWLDAQNTSVDFDAVIARRWLFGVAGRQDERLDLSGGAATSALAVDVGSRVDGAAKIGYQAGDRWDLYGIGQTTVSRSATRRRNDRAGGGAHFRVTDRFKTGGELTGGVGGLGARVDSIYKYDDRTDLYSSYLMESTPLDAGFRPRSGSAGALVSGVRGRYSDSTSVHYESRYLHGNQPSGLTHSFGVDFAPAKRWTVGVSGEKGELTSQTLTQRVERTAAGLSLGYDDGKTKAGSALEFRDENSNGGRRKTYFTRNQVASKVTQSLRALGKVNLSRSENSQGDFFDGDWTEAVIGLAYRPVNNDRLNMLFKYGYYGLTPSPGQVDTTGAVVEFRQRSQVFSLDVIYDLTSYLSVGAKGAFALRELQSDRTGGPWFRSNAYLSIARADFHVLYGWDATLEARSLWVEQAKDQRAGALAALYRYLSRENTIKLGVGYNFTDFSDNLTDLNYNSHGWFVNLVGAF